MAFDQSFLQDLKPVPNKPAAENSSDYFNCNICLDSAHEPVVTLCGHLYCWPCIYKWLHLQIASPAYHKHPQCPVCKADTSYTTMIPVYGLGQSKSDLKTEAPFKSTDQVPPRSAACGNQALLSTAAQSRQRLLYHNPRPFHEQNLVSSHLVSTAGRTMTGALHPASSMSGEMVYAQVFGNSDGLYARPNSYHLPRGTTLRLRRFYRQADRSLHRISMFLFCCLLLCLIVF